MKNRTQIWKILAFLGAVLFLSDTIYAQQWTSDSHSEYKRDTLPFSQRFIHRLGVEGRAGYIFQTSPFLEYSNHQYKAMKNAYAGHLKYSFQLRPHTVADQAYIGAYQGIGVGYFNFGNPEELGNPLAVYLFQGGRIAQFSPRISLNYEWNFGACLLGSEMCIRDRSQCEPLLKVGTLPQVRPDDRNYRKPLFQRKYPISQLRSEHGGLQSGVGI